MAAKTYTINDVAERTGMTPRAIRKALRADVREAGGAIGKDTPGKGKRYTIDARTFGALCKRFASKDSETTEPQTANV